MISRFRNDAVLFYPILQKPTDFANLKLFRCEEIEVDKVRLFGLQPDSQVIDKLFKELVLFTARAA